MEDRLIDFKAVFKYLPGNSILVLPNPPFYTILAVTEGMIKRSGLPEDQLVNRSFFEPFPANPSNPDDPNSPAQNVVLNSFQSVMINKQTDALPVIRYDLANPDGTFTEFYWKVSHKPIFDEGGNILYILHTSEDVTDAIKADRREIITKGIEKMHDLFMETPLSIGIFKGQDLTIELANAAMLQVWGEDDNVIGKQLDKVIPELREEGIIEIMQKVRNTGEADHIHKFPVKISGKGLRQTIYLNMIFQPYYEADKEQAVGVIAIGTDVTDKLLIKKEADELRERFETIANNIPNLAWVANADGWIFWYNNRWYEYTGTTPEQMEGWGWQSVHHPEQLSGVIEKWKNSISTGNPFEMVFPILGADKKFRPFLTRVIPIKDSDGNVLRWIGTNTDIEKQKEVERMKDDFISITSHELNTPVTTIKAYVQIVHTLLEHKDDAETLGMIKKMDTQVNRLATLIQDLLNVTRLQQGKLSYNESEFDFHGLLSGVIDDLQQVSSTHKILIQKNIPVTVFGDKDKLSQVLINVISNAVKYSPSSDKIIINSDVENVGVVVSVQDFGIGISANDQQKIFEQFYRVTEEPLATFPGMGIGLYIASEIVKNYYGKISIKSNRGEGSIFYIWIPLDYRKANSLSLSL